MQPTEDLRRNRATFAVTDDHLPALAHWMHDALPNEPYDPHFFGQRLITTYFDTRKLLLRRARLNRDGYCTLRIREYPGGSCALSVKTENQKRRFEISRAVADLLLSTLFSVTGPPEEISLQSLLSLPADIMARLMEMTDDEIGRASCRE